MKDSNGELEPAYDHVIPAPVFYDERLSGDDKLLYGLIRALCRKEGYCWAANDYLARKFKIDIRTVQRRVQSLANAGHVHVEISRGKETVRRIYLVTNLSPPRDKLVTPPHDKSVTHSKERKKMKKEDEETSPPKRRNRDSLPLFETVLGAVACGAGKNKRAKDRKRDREADALGLIEIWQRAWKEQFPNAPFPIWTKRIQGALVGYRKRFRDWGRTDFEEYMEWSVLHWRTVTALQFKGWRKVPELPTVLWWIYHSSEFEMQFSVYKENEAMMSLTLEERMIARLRSEGYTPEAAKREVDQELGFARESQRLDEKERKINRHIAWLKSKEKWLFDRAALVTRQIMATNPNASKETLIKLADAEITKLWEQMEKGFEAYESGLTEDDRQRDHRSDDESGDSEGLSG